jgi:hypothetical protein
MSLPHFYIADVPEKSIVLPANCFCFVRVVVPEYEIPSKWLQNTSYVISVLPLETIFQIFNKSSGTNHLLLN